MSMPDSRIPLRGMLVAAAGLALASVGLAGEQTLTQRDYTNRGFPPDLVEYRVQGAQQNWDKVRVVRADGTQVPCQVRRDAGGVGMLQFVTALAPNETLTYTVRDAGGERATGNVKATPEGANLVLSNANLAVRIPGAMNKTFNPPVAAATLPAPILAFRNSTGQWLGGSAILTQKTVKALRVELVNSGSVCAEVSYQLDWADGGYYRATLQVIDQAPLVKVREEYDMNVLDGTHFWELDLAKGWKPDRAQTASHQGNGGGDPDGRVVDFAGLMAKSDVQYLLGDQAWGKLSYLALFTEAERKAAPRAYPLTGVVPLRKGLWRRSNALEVRSGNANDMRVRFPMGVRHAEWNRDITSETSPFATPEHDPNLPLTYGRRVWGLALGQPPLTDPDLKKDNPAYQLQCTYGIIGLDRYKDFILDWQDGNLTYPRLYKNTVAGGDAANCLIRLQGTCRYYFTTTHSSHHYTSGHYGIAAQADAVLGQPGLTAEMRREIRARLALLTYIYEDADMMSYGNGHHHGNPNMGTARYWSGPTFMALVPDHPLFPAWRDHMGKYGEYNMSSQIAPGGGYFEYGAAYHMHGYARATNGVPGLQSADAENAERLVKNYVAPDWRYYMNLLTPYDPRWKSRIIPGLANSPPGNTENFAEAAGTVAKSEPQLAANLLWAWQANGAKKDYNNALVPTNITPVEPALTSQIYPGVGVIFRAHQGPQETYMFLRAGFQWSHWTTDPGQFMLFSKGAVLVPDQPFQYGGSNDKSFDWMNTIRFGHLENTWPHGWGDSTVLEHMFGASVDYAWASTGFPDWYINPSVSPKWRNAPNVGVVEQRKLDATPGQQEGAFTWNRQVMFMKGKTATSPNYFVFRDSVPGDGKLVSYLHLNLLGTMKDVNINGGRIAVDTEWATKLDVQFMQPATITPASSEQRAGLALHNSNLADRVGEPGTISRNWVKADGSPWIGKPAAYATQENHTILRIPGAPGAGYFWVLYPRGENEPAPQISMPADGVLKIVHPEGTDYVFLGSTPVSYNADGVVFEGRAGAVRMTNESVTLVKTGGAGMIGYKGQVLTGVATCERNYPLAKLAVGESSIMSPMTKISLPATAPTEKALAPGVTKGDLGNGVIRYRLGAQYTRGADGDVRLEGSGGMVEITGNTAVRFVAEGDCYVQFSVGNRGVRGVGPFDLTFTATGITGRVDGATRSLVVTWPDGIVRPMFRMDGMRYYAGWPDDHSIGIGTATPQFCIGFGVTDGPHQVEITEWAYPELPVEPKRLEIKL